MKVILLKDVQTIGRKFDVKDVADGYAINFLLPQKLAEMATEKSLKKVEEMKKHHEVEKKVQEELLLKNLESINGIEVTIEEKSNDQGHLFASIHKEKIVEELKKQVHIDVLPEFIELAKPIKEVGEREVVVKVQDKTATFKLVVKGL
jgi:large subunit ribosomal protein L9